MGIATTDWVAESWVEGGAVLGLRDACLWCGAAALCGAAPIARYSAWRSWSNARPGDPAVHAVLALLAFILGSGAIAARLVESVDGAPQAPARAFLEGRVGRVSHHRLGIFVDLSACRSVENALRVPTHLRLHDGGLDPSPLAGLIPGDRLRFPARFLPPQGRRNPGGRSKRRMLARSGIAAEAWLVSPTGVARLDRGSSGPRIQWMRLRRGLAALRVKIGRRLRREGRGGALLAALSLGDRRGLDDATSAFQTLGIAHLVALSGLHFASVGALCFAATRRLGRCVALAERVDPRSLGLAAAIVGMSLFALFVGSAVSVKRAWILAVFTVFLLRARRRVSPIATLALAALLLLALEPALLFEPGAQLSFGACAGLVAARARGQSRIAIALRANAAAHVATTPILAGALGTTSVLALPANALLVPWFAGVLLPVALVAAFFTALSLPGSHAVVIGASALAERSLDAVAWWVGADALPRRVALHPLSFALTVLAAGALLCSERLRWLLLGSVVLPFVLTWLPAGGNQRGKPRIVIFDVGQGDAALVESGGAAILIDGGFAAPGRGDRGASTVLPALTALGVRALDLVIASHRDLDHRGGLVSIVKRIPVDTLWLPYGARSDAAFADLVTEAAARGVSIEERGAGATPWKREGLRVDPLWPAADFRGSANDRSLVVRVSAHGVRALFSGDLEVGGERALLASGVDLRADFLKVPHHGSRSSSSPAFVNAVSPVVAIASAKAFNRFGMPDPKVRARYRRVGAVFWWTGPSGALWFHLTKPRWVWATVGNPESSRRRDAPH